MKIESFKKKNSRQYQVVGEKSLTLFDETILKYDLLLKKEIDEDLLNEILNYDKNIAIYYNLVKTLKSKRKTEKEVIDYLKKESINDEIIDSLINKLKTVHLINDEEYLQAYINDSVNLKNTGPRKIETDLLALGFKDSLIKKYLLEINNDVWVQKINKLIQKKLKSNHNYSGMNLKVKIAMYIVQLGYSKDMVMKEINKYDYSNLDVIKKDYEKAKRVLGRKYQGDELDKMVIQKMFSKGYSLEQIEEIKSK